MLIDEVIAEYVLGGILAEDLKDRAYSLLLAGCESPNLAALVGATKDQAPADLRDLFMLALRDLGVSLPNRLAAGYEMRAIIARKVMCGELAPRDGASKIVGLFHSLEAELPKTARYLGDSFGVAHLLGAYYSYDDIHGDDPSAVREVDDWIVSLCGRLARGEDANPPE